MEANYSATVGFENGKEIRKKFTQLHRARAFCRKYVKEHPRSKIIPSIVDLNSKDQTILGYVVYYPDTNVCLWATYEPGIISDGDLVTAITSDDVYYDMYLDGNLGRRYVQSQTIIKELK